MKGRWMDGDVGGKEQDVFIKDTKMHCCCRTCRINDHLGSSSVPMDKTVLYLPVALGKMKTQLLAYVCIYIWHIMHISMCDLCNRTHDLSEDCYC